MNFDVTTGPVTSSIPSAVLIAAVVAVLLLFGGSVTLIALYNRIRNGIIATIEEVFDARMTKHEKEEIEHRDRQLYSFQREVDGLKKDIDRIERDVSRVHEAVERHGPRHARVDPPEEG